MISELSARPAIAQGRGSAARFSGWPVLAGIAGGKLAVLLVIFLAVRLMPFNEAQFEANFVDPAYRHAPDLVKALSAWDGQHYLFLSENGYHAGQMSNAFFPLFPLLIHWFTPLTGSSLGAGLLVSNLASLAGLYLFYRFVAEHLGNQAGRRTLLLLLAFPTAFFFTLVYSESLFLLLAAGFFLLLFRRRYGWAAIPAALLPLTRPEGALIILPFVAYYLIEERGQPLLRLRSLLPLAPLLGIAAYLAFMDFTTGSPLEMMNAMAMYPSQHSLLYVLHPVQLVRQLGVQPLAIHGYTNSMIDRAVFVLFLALLPAMFLKLHPALAIYALAVGGLSVASGTFMSYSRYLLLVFPLFMAAALLLQPLRRRWLSMPIAYGLLMVQAIFAAMYALDFWVG